MSIPVTKVKAVYPKEGYDPAHIIVTFKGKEYRMEKNVLGNKGLTVFVKKGRGFYILKTPVGEGAFKDMLKNVEGMPLPPGYKQ